MHPTAPGKFQALCPVTTIEAHLNVGLGNQLFIRGQGDGLSWEKGQPLTCLEASRWLWSSERVQGAVTFNSDQFVMFDVASEDAKAAQKAMAAAVMNPTFQSAFNVVKGSVPARTDVPNTDFDDCGKKGMADLADANTNGRLFGSMAHGHSVPAAIKNAIYDVVTAEFNGEYDAATAAQNLVTAVEAAK